jgi:hypothetical protein
MIVMAGTYLASYDGIWGRASDTALRAFQTDNVFVSEDGRSSTAVPGATPGVVRPGDATWRKLIERMPAAFADLRALPGGKTVYIAATAEQLQAKIASANAATFTPAFKSKVIVCIQQMHNQHGIALGVCRQGDRRDFQTQFNLFTSGRGVTNAGPGESNHNFGMAVDLGFEGLRWLRKDGTPVTNEDSWLHQLDPKQIINDEARLFWAALRTVGTSSAVQMFQGPPADRPHLQNWDDARVSMKARLADLLTRSGTMKWSAAGHGYSCDLGLGGAQIPVGTAAEIWNNGATITLAALKKAREAAAAVTRQPAPTPAAPPAPITEADVSAMKRQLREQLELAEANWQAWTPY